MIRTAMTALAFVALVVPAAYAEDGRGAIRLDYAPAETGDLRLAEVLARRFAERARSALDEAVDTVAHQARRFAAGETSFPPFYGRIFERREQARTIEAADGRRLISVEIEDDLNFGGAHPVSFLGAMVWDVAEGREVPWPALFGAETPPEPIVTLWRAAALRAKRDRVGPDLAAEWEAGLAARPVDLASTPVALAPSTEPGSAGGLLFLHEAYTLGAYAEGPYRVVLPLAEIADALSPAYAPFFAGAPAPIERRE